MFFGGATIDEHQQGIYNCNMRQHCNTAFDFMPLLLSSRSEGQNRPTVLQNQLHRHPHWHGCQTDTHSSNPAMYCLSRRGSRHPGHPTHLPVTDRLHVKHYKSGNLATPTLSRPILHVLHGRPGMSTILPLHATPWWPSSLCRSCLRPSPIAPPLARPGHCQKPHANSRHRTVVNAHSAAACWHAGTATTPR